MHPQQRLLWFRRLALAGALLAAAVVVLGAWVRLTNAGLGCPDWPGCYGHIYPNAGHGEPQTGFRFGKALHEMIHRYFAGTLVLVITILLVWAVRYRKDRDQPLIPHVRAVVVVVVAPRTAGTACARSGFAKVCFCGSRRPDHANRSRGMDQQQLRRGGVPGFTHLPTLLVAADGLSRRLRAVARTRHRLRRRRAGESRPYGHTLYASTRRPGRGFDPGKPWGPGRHLRRQPALEGRRGPAGAGGPAADFARGGDRVLGRALGCCHPAQCGRCFSGHQHGVAVAGAVAGTRDRHVTLATCRPFPITRQLPSSALADGGISWSSPSPRLACCLFLPPPAAWFLRRLVCFRGT